MLKCVVPKQFLWRYELKLGANVFGIVMVFVMVACIVAAIVDMLGFTYCETNSYSVKRSAYAFSVITIIYSIIMIVVHVWFLWGIRRNKASVVLVWVVVNGLWLLQTAVLTVVLVCLYMADTSFVAWIMCLIFGIIAFLICLYGVLIGYGLWLEMKSVARATVDASPS